MNKPIIEKIFLEYVPINYKYLILPTDKENKSENSLDPFSANTISIKKFQNSSFRKQLVLKPISKIFDTNGFDIE